MIWSFSTARVFRKCQRQWYFKTHVANARAKKDAIRREAYLLSKLQSVFAWRGSLVDHVISRRIVPALNNNWTIRPSRIIEYASDTFEAQLEFAKQHRLREPGMSPSKDDAFAAFHAIEYATAITEKEIAQAWTDVEQALTNLLEMRELLILLSTATSLVSQRALAFPFGEVTVRAFPDLIAFFRNEAPLIVDWKVHTFGTQDYRLQLACYALALTRCNPHKDFPTSLSSYQATDIRLLEVQLLTNQQYEYALSNTDIEDVDAFVFESIMQMTLAKGNDPAGITPFDFPVTISPSVCQRCGFRSLCWEKLQ